jgi:hypothetical protein
VGKSWSGVTLQELPAEPEGPLLDLGQPRRSTSVSAAHCRAQHHCLQCIIDGGLQWQRYANNVETHQIVTAPHTQDWIELLSQAKAHRNIFAATSGIHLTANDIFGGIVLKQRKLLHKKIKKKKMVCEHQERNETNALHIQATKSGDHMKLTSSNLTILLTWHQHAKVATIKREDKLAAWLAIVGSGKAPPSFERWTNANNAKLLEAQSDVVKMAHMALGHL